MKSRPGILVSLMIGVGIFTYAVSAWAEEENKEAGSKVVGAVSIAKGAGTQAAGQSAKPIDPQAKKEYQKRLDEAKKLSLEKQAARRDAISDLKQKWTKVESNWNTECTRHDAKVKEIEKMPDGPERQAKIDAENASHRAKSKEIAVERNVVHERVIEQANREVAGGSKNTSGAARQTAGTKITDPNFRGMNGDFDAGAGYRTTEKAAKILNEIGVKSPTGGPVQVKNGVLETSGKFGMTVNADAGLDKIGSAGHQAQVKTGAQHGETYVSETGHATQSKPLKDHVATLDHTKKAMHGLNENPGKLVGGSPEGQVMVKGTLKAAGQAGLAPETIEAIARKNGIKNPENLLDRLAEIKSGRSTITSVDEAAKLQGASRDILNASETATKTKAAAEVQQTQSKIADLEAKGKMQEAQKLRQEVADYRAKAQAQTEALAHPEKAPAGSGKEPSKTSTTTEVRGEPTTKPGSAVKGEPTTRPGSKVTGEPTTRVSGEPEAKTAGGGKLMRGAGWALGAYGIYEGYKTAVEEMMARKQGEPKGALEWTSNKAELVGRTLWHGLGFGAMADIGTKAGQESFEQYKKDIADGKISKDSMSAYLWMKARAVTNGFYGGAKAITYDAAKHAGTGLGESIKEGGGVVKDTYGWFKGVRIENQSKAEQSKKIYDKLIKDGASTMGAQRAADGVKKGDFTEAKRLAKILEAKRDAKIAKTQKSAPSEPKSRTERESKKEDISKEAKKQEQIAREKLIEEKRKLAEAAEAKKRAKAAAKKAASAAGAKSKAASEKGSKMMAKASKALAEKAASVPVLAPGTHEEVSGWAENKNGKTRLTYIKDAAGNVLGGYYTHFDPNGNETGREDFKTPTESSPEPVPASPSAGAPSREEILRTLDDSIAKLEGAIAESNASIAAIEASSNTADPWGAEHAAGITNDLTKDLKQYLPMMNGELQKLKALRQQEAAKTGDGRTQRESTKS